MIPYGKHHIDEDDIQAVVDILRSSFLTQGPAVEAFEKAVAEYVGVKYAVAVSSGTAALHLAALAAGVGPGTSVVTSPITFVASANASRYCGGDVLFADIDPETVNMSPDALREVLLKNSNVKAIIPVHFAGLPCDMVTIKNLADEAGAVVIEDAAHALGATYLNGRRVGCCENSLMTIFSFHPVKAIAAGEGGMITTNDEAVYRRLLRLRSHGINKMNDQFMVFDQAKTKEKLNPWYYEMQELGYHYRITDIQCGLALSQFKKLDKFIKRRREIAKKYDEAISNSSVFTPVQISGRENSGHHLYVLKIDFDKLGSDRASFMMSLRDKDIITQVHYMPIPMHPFYRGLGFVPDHYPNSVDYYQKCLSIPIYYSLSEHEQCFVVDAITLR
ncbi:UDP-4-amino-4,6-dideoxy-N-acetyl-beta-L-altrosamine transaminase [Candidatus Methylopumilus planktonicus]|uniref:UDP-4-amino-4, 6-dideoxy-N-acetyl-beta-L-altrosamine transaminase n=1 Tax=Candidatus Methylopumilus planktonicus TaxID=1581557 RepID=UPI003BEF18B3